MNYYYSGITTLTDFDLSRDVFCRVINLKRVELYLLDYLHGMRSPSILKIDVRTLKSR